MLTDLETDLRRRSGPRLADGVELGALIDFDERSVSMRVFCDPEIYELELERIFAREWVFLAHESDLPEPGDFVQRYLGEDSVVVARSRTGDISVLLNVCAHRGMEVCWSDQGNTRAFKCPYHGWTFDTTGALLGAPAEREMYGPDWDKSKLGLQTAHVVVRHGLIFGSFGEHPPAFDDFLGDMAWYFNSGYSYAGEVDVVLPPPRLTIESNWKFFTDNFSGDGYHVPTLHRAISETGVVDSSTLKYASDLLKVSFPAHGHTLVVTGDFGEVDDRTYAFDKKLQYSITLFPNGQGDCHFGLPTPDGTVPFKAFMISSAIPKGVNRFEWGRTWLLPKGWSDDDKRTVQALLAQEIATQADDWEAWASIQRAAERTVGRRQTVKYNSMMSFDGNSPPEWPGPGVVYTGPARDESQWQFWMHWFDRMTADEA